VSSVGGGNRWWTFSCVVREFQFIVGKRAAEAAGGGDRSGVEVVFENEDIERQRLASCGQAGVSPQSGSQGAPVPSGGRRG
jgi:hypothetical protein